MTTIAHRKGRWTPLAVAASVLGFLVWWPVGLAVIAYVMWGGSIDDLAQDGWKQIRQTLGNTASTPRASGNAAFDAYREETLKRLEQEQAEFDAFVARLRDARDREEFEKFMSERKSVSIDEHKAAS